MTEKPTDAQLVALAERLGWHTHKWPDGWWINVAGEDSPISWLTTPDGALGAIQAAMAGLGWTFMMRGAPGEDYSVEFHTRSIPRYFYGDGSTAPDAIVLAACAALGLDKEDTR